MNDLSNDIVAVRPALAGLFKASSPPYARMMVFGDDRAPESPATT